MNPYDHMWKELAREAGALRETQGEIPLGFAARTVARSRNLTTEFSLEELWWRSGQRASITSGILLGGMTAIGTWQAFQYGTDFQLWSLAILLERVL